LNVLVAIYCIADTAVNQDAKIRVICILAGTNVVKGASPSGGVVDENRMKSGHW